ncbi:MAG: hypothetical protein PHT34_02445 [Oscillospiraceae bacterium]|nr:hypothetical protein [Oscillospiraceae bacterium]
MKTSQTVSEVESLRSFGVIEKPDEKIARTIAAGLEASGVLFFGTKEHPELWAMELGGELAQFRDSNALLLIFSPKAKTVSEDHLRCRCVLLPGDAAGAASRFLYADCAVSYGMSPRDTITLSSIEEENLSLAIQRELVTVDGKVVEQQEIQLHRNPGLLPETILAAAGALLLLGVPPEALRF